MNEWMNEWINKTIWSYSFIYSFKVEKGVVIDDTLFPCSHLGFHIYSDEWSVMKAIFQTHMGAALRHFKAVMGEENLTYVKLMRHTQGEALKSTSANWQKQFSKMLHDLTIQVRKYSCIVYFTKFVKWWYSLFQQGQHL